MKKNNRFRNNGSGNSNAYSLNYRFDSVSPAGKCSGTALDLIKRYNELAKEAHGSGDYVTMEVYRQYAEHYRKIVTEINERKGVKADETTSADGAKPDEETAQQAVDGNTVENDSSSDEQGQKPAAEAPRQATKSFHVIEIHAGQAEVLQPESAPTEKPKRQIRRRKSVPEASQTTQTQAEVV
jgi:hypothetical protein